MQTIALVSGLIGALVSGALSFGIRMYLDKRAEKEAARKLGYVYMLRVSEFVALEIVVRAYAKAYVSEDLLKTVKPPNSTFDTAHAICAFLAEGLVKRPTADSKTNAQFRKAERLLESMLDGAKETRLSAEQLSKLHRETILASQQFQSQHQQMCLMLQTWSDLISSTDRSWADAAWFHNQWRAAVTFTNSARVLRLALSQYGASTEQEAASVLMRQVRELHDGIAKYISDKPHLDAALDIAKKLLAAEGAA